MILTTYLIININGRTFSYWKNKGYIIPTYKDKFGRIRVQRNTKIEVKVSDLPKGSHIKVLCKCDNCGKERILKFAQYNPICKSCNLHSYQKDLNPNWKNGFPKCKICGSILKDRRSSFCVDCLWKQQVGSKHPKYNHKLTEKERKLSHNRGLNSKNYFWKKEVLQRDNHTCQKCSSKEYLQVHHIDNFNENIQRRYDINNGITLCKKCHKLIHKIFGNKTNTNHLEKFLSKII